MTCGVVVKFSRSPLLLLPEWSLRKLVLKIFLLNVEKLSGIYQSADED
jgi:hypothetical protein